MSTGNSGRPLLQSAASMMRQGRGSKKQRANSTAPVFDNLFKATNKRVEKIRENPVVHLERVQERVEAAILEMAFGTSERRFMEQLRIFGTKFAGGVGLEETSFWVDEIMGLDALVRIVLKRLLDRGLVNRARRFNSIQQQLEDRRKKPLLPALPASSSSSPQRLLTERRIGFDLNKIGTEASPGNPVQDAIAIVEGVLAVMNEIDNVTDSPFAAQSLFNVVMEPYVNIASTLVHESNKSIRDQIIESGSNNPNVQGFDLEKNQSVIQRVKELAKKYYDVFHAIASKLEGSARETFVSAESRAFLNSPGTREFVAQMGQLFEAAERGFDDLLSLMPEAFKQNEEAVNNLKRAFDSRKRGREQESMGDDEADPRTPSKRQRGGPRTPAIQAASSSSSTSPTPSSSTGILPQQPPPAGEDMAVPVLRNWALAMANDNQKESIRRMNRDQLEQWIPDRIDLIVDDSKTMHREAEEIRNNAISIAEAEGIDWKRLAGENPSSEEVEQIPLAAIFNAIKTHLDEAVSTLQSDLDANKAQLEEAQASITELTQTQARVTELEQANQTLTQQNEQLTQQLAAAQAAIAPPGQFGTFEQEDASAAEDDEEPAASSSTSSAEASQHSLPIEDASALMSRLDQIQTHLNNVSLPAGSAQSLEDLSATTQSLAGLLERLSHAVEQGNVPEAANAGRRARAQANTAAQQADFAIRRLRGGGGGGGDGDDDPVNRLRVEKAKLDILRARRELANAMAGPVQVQQARVDSPASALDRLRIQEASLRVAKQRADLEKALREQREDRQPAHPADPQPSAFDRLKLRQLMAQVRLTEERARKAEVDASQQASSSASFRGVPDRSALVSAQREQLALRRDQLKLEMDKFEFDQKRLERTSGKQEPSPEELAKISYERQKRRLELQRMAIELRVAERKAQQALGGPTEAERRADAITARQNDLRLRKDLVALQTEQMRANTARQEARRSGSLEKNRLEVERQKLQLDQLRANADLKRLEALDPTKQGEMEMQRLSAQTARAEADRLNAEAKLKELESLEGFRQQQAALEVEREALRNAQEEIKLRNAQDARRAKGPNEDDMEVLADLLNKWGAGGIGEFRNILRDVHIGDLWDQTMLHNFVTSRFFAAWSTTLTTVNNKGVTRPLTMRDTIVDFELQDQIMELLVKRYNNMTRASDNVGSTTGLEASGLLAGGELDSFIGWLRGRYGSHIVPGTRQISPFLQLDGRSPQDGIPLLLNRPKDVNRAQQDLQYHFKYTPNIPVVFVPAGARGRGNASAYMTSAL